MPFTLGSHNHIILQGLIQTVKKYYESPQHSFYFVRHGETEWNCEQRIMGQTDIPLSPIGIAQAHQAAKYLQNLGLERLVSSPLRSAKHTADILGNTKRK